MRVHGSSGDTFMTLTLAQLSDALPLFCWYLTAVVGLSAPAAGLLLSVLLYGFRRRWAKAAIVFHGAALPLAGLMFITRIGDPLGVGLLSLAPNMPTQSQAHGTQP
jgi:hypothetical protein